MLGATTGARIAGRYCATDLAFEDLRRHARIFPLNPVWAVCIERIVLAEAEHELLGDFDREVVGRFDDEGMFLGDQRYEKALELFEEMDDFASAIFVTLGSRLRGVSEAVNRVFKAAALEGIRSPEDKHKFGGYVGQVPHVGDFAKHRDGWGDELGPLQKRTLAALIQLGVATDDPQKRFTCNWVASNCAMKLGRQPSLWRSLREVVTMCCESVEQLPDEIDKGFEPFMEAMLTKRKALQAKQRVRATRG